MCFFLARVWRTLHWCVLHQIKCKNLGGNFHHHRPQRLPCWTMFHTLGMRWPNTPLVHPFRAAFLAVAARGSCNVSSLVAAPQWPCRVFRPTAMRNAFWPSKFASRISVVPKKWWSTSGPVSGRYLEDVVKHETKHETLWFAYKFRQKNDELYILDIHYSMSIFDIWECSE